MCLVCETTCIFMAGAGVAVRKKQTPQPKHRLPVLNWVAMKSNQVKGTVFSELDDEKLYSVCASLFILRLLFPVCFMTLLALGSGTYRSVGFLLSVLQHLVLSFVTFLSKPSMLWHCWLGIRPVKRTQWWGAGMVICLERGADLHVAQLKPLPLTLFCFSKIQIGFTFLVLAHPGSPEKGPLNGCMYFSVQCASLKWLTVSYWLHLNTLIVSCVVLLYGVRCSWLISTGLRRRSVSIINIITCGRRIRRRLTMQLTAVVARLQRPNDAWVGDLKRFRSSRTTACATLVGASAAVVFINRWICYRRNDVTYCCVFLCHQILWQLLFSGFGCLL